MMTQFSDALYAPLGGDELSQNIVMSIKEYVQRKRGKGLYTLKDHIIAILQDIKQNVLV